MVACGEGEDVNCCVDYMQCVNNSGCEDTGGEGGDLYWCDGWGWLPWDEYMMHECRAW
jgi:hypothetical protein